MRWRNAALIALVSTVGCAVGPRYQRPTVDVPPTFRAAADAQSAPEAPAGVEPLGTLEWSQVFRDPELQKLIQTAIGQNYDVRLTATRILQAEANVMIVAANEYPTLSGQAQLTSNRSAQSFFPSFTVTQGGFSAGASWVPDFWRQFRSATEAARAQMLQQQWARQAVISTLVGQVATAYFQLRELDMELDLSRNTLASRKDSLGLVQVLAGRGIRSDLDVSQAEELVYTVSQTIPDLERQIEQQENLISTLLGASPGPIERGLPLTEQPMPAQVPPGLPSSLLERRPDIRQAEEQLIAANAELGVVRAAVLPTLTLTGSGGFESEALRTLFSGPATLFNLAGTLTQPIFERGRLHAGIQLSEAEKEQMVLAYEQTVQQALRQVSDALIAYRKNQESREQQELLVQSTQEAAHLSDIRYRGGVSSYLEVLTAETDLFSAQRSLVQAQLNERLALVQLYQALGGGWQP